jgi:3-dehydroquinate synthetase
LNEVVDFILKIYGKVSIEKESSSALLELMKNDKKNKGAAINFTLLSRLGEASINHTCDEKLIKESLKYYINL